MIKVRELSKWFGRIQAVHGITFEVRPGEVVGLLGANGAGKTTTLRMITGFLPPDTGSVSINGFDSLEGSSRARKHLGYLAEAAPAYGEMSTVDYLRFRGRLYGLARADARRAVDAAVAACDLGDVRGRRVGQLSRGYRQRVGLAGAILHDPPVLVLDEPISALDPKQIRQVRSLIREQARSKAVLISSHILPEVEQTCDRVIVMARGRVLADGTPAALVQRSRAAMPYIIEVRVDGPAEPLVASLGALAGVANVGREPAPDAGWVRLRLDVGSGSGDLREPIARVAARAGALVRELRREAPTLERVFIELMEEASGAQEAA